MSTFLLELAEHLRNSYKNDLSKLVVMFPSLRARAFFNDALSSVSQDTIWQPHYTSIDEVMERASGLKRVDQIRLLGELYNVYKERFPNETFDHFYHWGCVLISDFDMIDKYMVNAKLLLVNLSDLKELEADVSYLTKEQKDIIKSFWSNFQNKQDIDDLSIQKQRFLEMWKALPVIYTNFRNNLLEKHIGYTGLIYRTAAERITNNEVVDIEPKRFIIAGFNALSKSEQILFKHLSRREPGADFYWDYDDYYVQSNTDNVKNNGHEAGVFISENIRMFPNANPISTNNFAHRKEHLSATACVSNIAQVKHIGEILKSIPKEELNKDTAIVLTDENLLTPLLHSLPESVEKVNVTMGYPIKNTLAYSLIEILVTLQTHCRAKDGVTTFYHKDVAQLLSHPYITDICGDVAREKIKEIATKRVIMVEDRLLNESIKDKNYSTTAEIERANDILSKLFVDAKTIELAQTDGEQECGWKKLAHYIVDVLNTISALQDFNEFDSDNYNNEHRLLVANEITKLVNLIEACKIPLSTEIFVSLLRRHLQTISIPYEGKPLDGLQILGILETRNLDFKNVIILSMTDANFPGNHTSQASLIPYNLRFAYEMPTPEQHEAMYAYYFYRLLQRAKRINMLYCSRADEKSTGECSRYIYQLDFEYGGVEKHTLGVDLNIEEERPISVAKGEREMEALMRYTDDNERPRLAPTALFKYVECPLKFYFSSIAGLRARNELTDKMDALAIGDILHKSMETLYTKYEIIGKPNPMASIEKLRKHEVVEPIVDMVIGEMLYNNPKATTKDFTGDTQLVREIIIKYIIDGIMYYDTIRSNYTITNLEQEINYRHITQQGYRVKLYGIADRIDTLSNGTKQIIDYKSGYKPHLEFKSIDSLFNGNPEQRISNVFQTLLYSMIVHKNEHVDTKPSLYYASRMLLNDDYSPLLKEIDRDTPQEIASYTMVSEAYEEQLKAILDELFDPTKAFEQAENRDTCTRCDYNRICKR